MTSRDKFKPKVVTWCIHVVPVESCNIAKFASFHLG